MRSKFGAHIFPVLLPLVFSVLVVIFLYSGNPLLAALDESGMQAIEQYRAAAQSGNPDQIKAAWNNIRGNRPALEHMAKNVPNLYGHYAQREGIEMLNAVHRGQASRGEIVPFDQIEGDKWRPPKPSGTKKVTGDRWLADLADPGAKHVYGKEAQKHPDLAKLARGEGTKLPVGQHPPTKIAAGSGVSTKKKEKKKKKKKTKKTKKKKKKQTQT